MRLAAVLATSPAVLTQGKVSRLLQQDNWFLQLCIAITDKDAPYSLTLVRSPDRMPVVRLEY